MREVRHDPSATLVRALRALSIESPITIASLADRLDVSTGAMEAALALAGDAGVDLVRDSGDRISLTGGFEALAPEAVAGAMTPGHRRAFDLHVIEATGSTNADLMGMIDRMPSGYVLACEWQTAGRGRRGRVWQAPLGGSLAFSLLWKFARGAGALGGLSLATGLAVAEALERSGATGVMLKWPNDLLAKRDGEWAKLGGILIEITSQANGPAIAVIGIGLNVRLGDAARSIDQPSTDLAALGSDTSRNRLLAGTLESLNAMLGDFERDGFAPLAARWNARHAFAGQAVTMAGENASPSGGVAVGVDAEGALIVETADGAARVVAGEVSLRLAV